MPGLRADRDVDPAAFPARPDVALILAEHGTQK
jgi:hypothetical protein